jgi:hypothetical protein
VLCSVDALLLVVWFVTSPPRLVFTVEEAGFAQVSHARCDNTRGGAFPLMMWLYQVRVHCFGDFALDAA